VLCARWSACAVVAVAADFTGGGATDAIVEFSE